jgi:hypothetical protein
VLAARGRFVGSTLVAPWGWSSAAVAFWIVVELGPIASTDGHRAALRYLAVAGTFCPLMAVMGAKRPQDRGWQWIVLSLWVVLAIPVAQHLLFTPGRSFSVFAAWTMFLGVLLVLELLSYLPTRNAVSVIMLVVAQCLLLGDALGWLPPTARGATWAAWLTFGAVLAAWGSRVLFPVSCSLSSEARWLRFRNAFGAFWALRVLQRVNQTAELQDWPVRLQWSGFHELPERTDPLPEQEIEQCLDTLLRRFVAG